MKGKNVRKALRAIKEDEFWSLSNPLIPIVIVIIIVAIIEKVVL